MKPTMEVEDVSEDKQNRYVTSDPLPRVTIVARNPVRLGIAPTGSGDPNTHCSVENDWPEDKGPLDQR